LAQIVRSEASRNRQALRKCEADLRAFENPDRYRRWAEALLAGLTRAERVGEGIRVPDPQDHRGPDLVVPVAPAVAPAKAAEQLFGKHRRALRGLRRATERREALDLRDRELATLEQRFEASGFTEEQCVEEMRRLRLPVALEPDTRAGRAASRGRPPRVEGVRVYYATSGEMILAGKDGRQNHRLTFKLAAPHDFWLHAMDVGGAHVILRNDSRSPQPGPSLAEAAAVAAFHSQASSQPWVDVQWTLRKNVKKPRGAKPGTVVLKRFETVRVRPGIPS
jgi:predicted ribosome quality control (RQC) complex YloA/Tae2 family protein